jgi:hypothetical protein
MVSIQSSAVLLLVAFSVGLPASAYGKGIRTFLCPFSHFVNFFRQEIKTSQVSFRNVGDGTATIERFTIRDFFGDVIADVGPSTGTPLPLNTDQQPPVNVTNIPSGANFYLESDFFFGLNPIPANPGETANQANARGFLMSAEVELRTKNVHSVIVGGLERTRQRDPGTGVETATRSETITECVRLRGE